MLQDCTVLREETHLVGMHIERINAQIVRRQVERLEHLSQSEVFAVSVDDNLLPAVSKGRKQLS